MISEFVVVNTASQIVTGVANALATSTGGPVHRAYVTVGEVAWDECNCGQLTLSVGRIYPSRRFADDFSTIKVGNCDNTLLICDMSLSIVRCVPGPDTNGNPPLPTALTDAARTIMSDTYVVRQTLACMIRGMYVANQVADWLIGDDVPVGPMGGCAGRELHFKLAWSQDCECGG